MTASQTTPLDPAINIISTNKPPQHVPHSLNTCGTRYLDFNAQGKYHSSLIAPELHSIALRSTVSLRRTYLHTSTP